MLLICGWRTDSLSQISLEGEIGYIRTGLQIAYTTLLILSPQRYKDEMKLFSEDAIDAQSTGSLDCVKGGSRAEVMGTCRMIYQTAPSWASFPRNSDCSSLIPRVLILELEKKGREVQYECRCYCLLRFYRSNCLLGVEQRYNMAFVFSSFPLQLRWSFRSFYDQKTKLWWTAIYSSPIYTTRFWMHNNNPNWGGVNRRSAIICTIV